MPIQPVIHSVLKNLANTLIGKAPGAAYEKWLKDGQTRSDIETAWNEAMERALAENSAFGALVDQQQLSKVIVEHSLDPYWLFDPDREQIWDAGSLRWIQTEQAKVAAEKFLEHFLDSWKRQKSFAARAQLYEQLRQNKLLETIRDTIASAFKDGIPIKTAPGYAPAASLLSEYCRRVAAGRSDQYLVDRKVIPKTLTTMRTAALAPVSLEEVFAEYDRIVLLGQGGLGKTRALRRREQDVAAQYKSGAGVCVPVYLKLSEYRGGSIERLVADRINNVLKGSGLRLAETPEESERVTQAWLEQGGRSVEILFDGLNETPESLVAELRTYLEDFLRYEQRVVLTSREHEIDPLPGGRIPAFVLTPLTRDEIETLLVRTLAGKEAELRSRLASDPAVAGLLSNPFLLGLVTELVLNSPGQTLPGNRALLMRASVNRIRPALRQEGRTGGAAARSGVVDEFLKELGWKMLRTGVVSASYSAVYSWNLPVSGFPLDEVLRAASVFRYLRSEGAEGELIEFTHPLFRDYFAAERICRRLELGDDLSAATEGQHCVPEWREPLQMTAGLCGAKSGDIVRWLAARDCLDLAYDWWSDSEARNDPAVTAGLAAALRGSVTPADIPYADNVVVQLGELRDPNAVPLIREFITRVGKWARFAAIPALEKIRSDEACRALVEALENRDDETERDAGEALHRIGSAAVPSLLHSSRGSAERLLREVAPQSVAELTSALEDTDRDVRARAVQALGASRDPEAAKSLIPLLLRDETLVRTKAAIALGELGNVAAAEALRQALTDENPGVRFEAASALWTRGWALEPARQAQFELRDSLGHHAWWRSQVLNCLIIRPDAEIVGLVFAACRDGNDEVRRSAFALLDRIEGDVDDLLREGLRDTALSIRTIAADEIFRRYGAEGLAWLIRSFQEDPAERSSILGLIDWRFGEAGRKFLVDVTKSDLDARIRGSAERQLSRGRVGSAALADSTGALHEHPGEEGRD